MRRLVLAALLFTAACSGSSAGGAVDAGPSDSGAADAGGDAGSSDSGTDAGPVDAGPVDAGPVDAGFLIAPHVPFPAIPDNGGPVLVHPKLVTLAFAQDPNVDARESFVDWVVDSGWYASWTPDYGIGPATVLGHVRLPGSVSGQLTETQIGDLVAGLISDGGVPSPVLPDGGRDDLLYAFFFPASSEELFGGGSVCAQYGTDIVGGFHWEGSSNGVPFPVAIIPTCQFGASVETDAQAEASASHELAEALTDPFPSTAVAFAFLDGPWNYTDGEVGDLCNGPVITEGGHTLTRVWSNAAVAAGGSPCIPQPDDPFFSVSTTEQVLVLDAGDTMDIEVNGWSTGPRSDWGVAAFGYKLAFFGVVPTTQLSASTVNNGQSVMLTVGVPANTPSGRIGYVALNAYGSSSDFIEWPLVVRVR